MTATTSDAIRDDRASVDKAISLLAALGDGTSREVGVSELARRAHLSKSTAHRVLGLLERNGVVERVGTDYRLGERLHRLGRSVYAPGTEHVRDLLLPFLADLYEGTRQTVHLSVLHGSDTVCLAKLYGHHAASVPSRIGGRLPAHATAEGKVLLAHSPDAAAQALSASLERLTAYTITDSGSLNLELGRVRREGVGYDDQESRTGLSCVAAPVLTRDGRAVAALSVTGPCGRIDIRRFDSEVRRVAAAASQTWNSRAEHASRRTTGW
ncbi:IclR family transcriptional regulator [Streptomyces sp. NPDC093085]|uniref:IclR family transcriptional regulator n=1 Tax=Streptomyces sp. NPDC093085 TaxID=3155068 RepID=UPI003414A2C7